MDWTSTVQKVKLGTRLIADEQQKCWQEDRCFNCLKRGHRANDCLGTKGEIPDKTKKESTASTTKVNAVKKKDVVLVETEAIETSDSDNESKTSTFRQKSQSEVCRQVGEVEGKDVRRKPRQRWYVHRYFNKFYYIHSCSM